MGYFKRNIVPGHFRGIKGGRMKRNPGYDISAYGSPYHSRLFFLMRQIPIDSWYKPKGAPTRRGNKKGQTKPR